MAEAERDGPPVDGWDEPPRDLALRIEARLSWEGLGDDPTPPGAVLQCLWPREDRLVVQFPGTGVLLDPAQDGVASRFALPAHLTAVGADSGGRWILLTHRHAEIEIGERELHWRGVAVWGPRSRRVVRRVSRRAPGRDRGARPTRGWLPVSDARLSQRRGGRLLRPSHPQAYSRDLGYVWVSDGGEAGEVFSTDTALPHARVPPYPESDEAHCLYADGRVRAPRHPERRRARAAHRAPRRG